MGKRQLSPPNTNGPGPWSYNLPSKIGKEGPKSKLIGKNIHKCSEASPGPTMYSPNFRTIKRRVPAFPLGTAPRIDRSFSDKKNIPGPGQYKLNERFNAPRFKFHKSKRLGLQLNETTPGPGSYKIPCSFANTATYTLPSRDPTFKFV